MPFLVLELKTPLFFTAQSPTCSDYFIQKKLVRGNIHHAWAHANLFALSLASPASPWNKLWREEWTLKKANPVNHLEYVINIDKEHHVVNKHRRYSYSYHLQAFQSTVKTTPRNWGDFVGLNTGVWLRLFWQEATSTGTNAKCSKKQQLNLVGLNMWPFLQNSLSTSTILRIFRIVDVWWTPAVDGRNSAPPGIYKTL